MSDWGNRKVFRALSVTDSFDCRVVRTWNEQRDGDYVRWREGEGTLRAASQMKLTTNDKTLFFKYLQDCNYTAQNGYSSAQAEL